MPLEMTAPTKEISCEQIQALIDGINAQKQGKDTWLLAVTIDKGISDLD